MPASTTSSFWLCVIELATELLIAVVRRVGRSGVFVFVFVLVFVSVFVLSGLLLLAGVIIVILFFLLVVANNDNAKTVAGTH